MAMFPVRAKKNLGQHFLKDEDIARRVAATLDVAPPVPILEVGPGTGMLTRFLLEQEREVTVVEVDLESVTYLNDHYPRLCGKILHQDFLRMDLDAHFDGNFSMIGNYPYHISSQIFFKVLENRDLIPLLCRDDTKRGRGTPHGRIARAARPTASSACCCRAWYDTWSTSSRWTSRRFIPPPKVKSAVVRLTRNKRRRLGLQRETIQNSGENRVQPAPQDAPQLPQARCYPMRTHAPTTLC
jgi:16S rRNA (adenine1518-N6/adenine1519-N6)-dimethyltransferase